MVKIAKLVSRNVKPAHSHDCEQCRFLGSLNGEDLYFCPNDGSYVRRTSSEPSDCGSLGDLTPEGTAYNLARVIRERRLPPNAYRA